LILPLTKGLKIRSLEIWKIWEKKKILEKKYILEQYIGKEEKLIKEIC
jgi:hypothetical protein